MRIVISLITPDKNRDDYIGFGDGRYLLYNKKNIASSVDDAFDGMIDDLVEADILELEADGLTMESTFVDVNGLKGSSHKWKGDRDGQTYQYQTYIVENPDRKGVFHWMTAVYTKGNEKCEDYLQTLGKEGVLTSQPANVDGQQGYRVTWTGRGQVDRLEMYLSFYILEDAENPDMVYVLGAKEQTSEGQMWKYLDSFTVK